MITTTINITPGLRINDAFARRLVDGMMADLAAHPIQPPVLAKMGNAKSQMRAFDKGMKQNGDFILHAELQTGSRHRFHLAYHVWGISELNWLTAVHVELIGTGPDRPSKNRAKRTFALSRHALERLVKRGAVRTSADLIEMLRRAWRVTTLASTVIDTLPRDGQSAWIVPVLAPSGVWTYLPLLRNTGKGAPLVAVTALSADMISHPEALEPLRRLLAANTTPDPEELRDAFRISATATRRGARALPKMRMQTWRDAA